MTKLYRHPRPIDPMENAIIALLILIAIIGIVYLVIWIA